MTKSYHSTNWPMAEDAMTRRKEENSIGLPVPCASLRICWLMIDLLCSVYGCASQGQDDRPAAAGRIDGVAGSVNSTDPATESSGQGGGGRDVICDRVADRRGRVEFRDELFELSTLGVRTVDIDLDRDSRGASAHRFVDAEETAEIDVEPQPQLHRIESDPAHRGQRSKCHGVTGGESGEDVFCRADTRIRSHQCDRLISDRAELSFPGLVDCAGLD